jgi:hypothetical protein
MTIENTEVVDVAGNQGLGPFAMPLRPLAHRYPQSPNLQVGFVSARIHFPLP